MSLDNANQPDANGKQVQVYISIGSNVEPEQHVQAGLALLREYFGVIEVSPIYQTTAVGFEGDDFLNGVIGLCTQRSVDEVAVMLRNIEADCGRVRGSKKFNSRTLDLDLLIYGELVAVERNLPRDEILKYAFVLKPLADIAPHELHPVLQVSYLELWERAGFKI